MTSQQQTDILNSIQEIVSYISDWRIKVLSTTQYSDGNVTGIKMTVWARGIQFPFFVGFSSDETFSGKLVLGVLSSDRDEFIDKLKLTNDKFGNGISKSYKITERFFKKEINEQKDFLKEWIYDEINLFSGVYRLGNGKHVKELLKDTPTDYANISYSKWFLLVELPWIVMTLGIIVFIISLRNFDGYAAIAIRTPYEFAAKMGLVIIAVGFIAILSTLGIKFKIRKARGQKATKNPFTWFTSYIGKVVGGLSVIALGIGIFILGALVALGLAGETTNNGSKSASRSSSSSSSGKNTVPPANNEQNLSWYICQHCGTVIKNSNTPSRLGCPRERFHEWYRTSAVGNLNYCCKNCGITIQTRELPSRIGCPNERFHDWYKL